MKKRSIFICIILIFLLLLGGLFACTSDTRSINFADSEYHVYLKGGEVSVIPDVVTRPKGNDYTLSVSNKAIASVEGISIKGLKEGIVTITATSGQFSATATLYVHAEFNAETDQNNNLNDGKHTVYFTSEYSSFAAQRIETGGIATEPTAPYVEGYTLFGWYLDPDFNNKYDFSTPVTENVTLYALWGYSDAVYDFETKEDKIYLKGFKIKVIPYETATLPSVDNEGNEIYGISAGAFQDAPALTHVTIPDNYVEIRDSAFENCPLLQTVTINGASLTTVGSSVFKNCVMLESVSFGGEGLKKIGANCFENCKKLNAINLPNSIETIESRAFLHCEALNITSLPTSLKVITMETFSFTAIKEIDIVNIEAIYNKAFWGTTTLTTIKNPNKLKTVASYCFGSLLSPFADEATAWLKNTFVTSTYKGKEGSSVTYLGNVLVYVSPVGVGTKPLPTYVKQSVTNIAGEAFGDVTNATAYFIGLNPPTYGTNAFGAQTSTSNVTRPTVDIVVPFGYTETYAREWLITNLDESDYYVPTDYSLSLIQRIYEETISPHVILDLTVFKRNPLKNFSDSSTAPIYYSKLTAKEANDPFKGIAYDTASQYYILHSYVGTETTLDVKTLLENDCASTSSIPTIEKIATYCFSANATLETIYLTERILYIDSYAFAEATALKKVYLYGDGTFRTSSYYLTQSSFNGTMLHKDFKIYVHQSQLDYYNQIWGNKCPSVKNRFGGIV